MAFEFLVVGTGGLDGGGGEQGVKTVHAPLLVLEGGAPLRLLIEVLEDVGNYGRNALRVHVGALGIDAFDVVVIDTVAHTERIEVVDAERQDGVVPDGIDNRVGVQLVSEGLLGGAQVCFTGTGGVFREDGCSGEAEEVVVAEGSRDVGGRELLDGGDDDRGGRVVDLFGELPGGLVGGDGPLGEGVIFADGLVVKVLAVDDEENLVDPLHACSELCGLEGGEGLSGAGRVPDVSAGGDSPGLLVHSGGLDALEDRFGRSDLVGAHHEESAGGVEHAVARQDSEDRALGQECGGEVGEVGNLVVGGVGPPHGEFVGSRVRGGHLSARALVFGDVLEAHGVGVVLGVCAVGDDEDLHVAEESVAGAGVEGVALVAVDLVEGFAQFFASPLEFDVDQGQAVDEDGDVVSVRACAGVDSVLANHLHLIAVNVGLVDEADVFGGAVVTDEDLHVVLLDAAGFSDDRVPVSGGGVNDRVTVKALPFFVAEPVVIEGLELDAQVRFEAVTIVDIHVFVGLSAQLFNEVVLEGGFALVVLLLVTGRVVEADDVDPMLTSPTVICVQAAPWRQLRDKPEASSTCLMKSSTPSIIAWQLRRGGDRHGTLNR